MSFVTIHLYVVMLNLMVNAVSGGVQDVSSTCALNKTTNYFLTNGVGSSDGISLRIKLQSPYTCASTFRVKKDFFISLVVHVPKMSPEDQFCVSEDFGRSVVTVSDVNCGKGTKIFKRNEVYSKVIANYVDVRVISGGKLKSVTITATGTRQTLTNTCAEQEIRCNTENKYYCMINTFVNDGIVRCHSGDLIYDDTKHKPLSKLVILFSIAMIIATTWITVSVLRNIFPKRGRTFIYKTDDNLSPYDARFSSLTIEVVVVIIFARESIKKSDKD